MRKVPRKLASGTDVKTMRQGAGARALSLVATERKLLSVIHDFPHGRPTMGAGLWYLFTGWCASHAREWGDGTFAWVPATLRPTESLQLGGAAGTPTPLLIFVPLGAFSA
jgi:hypothetical protein